MKIWLDQWKNDLSLTDQTYFFQAMRRFSNCPPAVPMFYYHFFSHQHLTLAVSENISGYSLSSATDKILSGRIVAVLDVPGSRFSLRPHIPILKSSYNQNIEDELANIPVFNDLDNLKCFFLLNQIKQYIQDPKKFIEFSIAYNKFFSTFNFSTWIPKRFTASNKLVTNNAFPASAIEIIGKQLSECKVVQGNIGDKVAQYNALGGVVLELNGYRKNYELSGHYGYEIYEAGIGSDKLLASIDKENGNFEMIGHDGTHIGAYNYVGEPKRQYTKQNDINSHSLRGIPTHMFMFK